MENNTNHVHCEDDLTLQRLLDEELDADANELVFHHLQGCERCSAIFQELKESKSLCEMQLGIEDEGEAVHSAAVLNRALSAIKSATLNQPKTRIFPLMGEETESESPRAADPRIAQSARRIWRPSFGSFEWGFLLRPGTVTALVALVFLAVALTLWLRAPTSVSAAELLRQSAANEDAINAHADQVLRRTINLEERVGQTVSLSDAGNATLHRRIEVWQSADNGLMARRLYDEKDRLVAGEWKKADGSRVIFKEANKPEVQPAAERQPSSLLSPERIWLLDISAKDFSALIDNVAAARVEQTPGTYVIKYEKQGPAAGGQGLVKATLVLSKADLHTIEQTLVVNSSFDNRQSAIGNRQWTEYRFVETSFERRSPSSVAPAVFEPDPSLLSERMKDEGGRMKEKSETVSPLPPVASAELEVEVLEKLNRVNAFLGEQLSLTRTPEGKLLVNGIVETSERKNEILRSLGEVSKNPAVKIDVSTVAEAQKREQRRASENITMQDVEVAQNTIPVDAELRSYLSRTKGLSGDQLEKEIEQLSRRVLVHSARARSHALALKQIAERFSASDLETMDAGALVRWRALIAEHAQFFRRELQQVRQELAPVFPGASSALAGANLEIANDKDIARAAKSLFELASVTDNGLRRSFSLSSERGTDAPVRSQQFWQSFASAEAIAATIGRQ